MSNSGSQLPNRKLPSIQVQSILFNNDLPSLIRALESIERATELAVQEGVCDFIQVTYGDCSPSRCITEEEVANLQERFSNKFKLSYLFFNENLGSARGHNRLGLEATVDFLLIQNPDVVISPRLFERMLEPFSMSTVGMVEAKQLPIEHPKEYNAVTGETGWATTACALIPLSLFQRLNGFDADSFFLYCDDVDFSWMVREAGLKVIFQPSAVVFHDKRLSDDGAWQPTAAERYYSAEAACLITYKWSRPDLTEFFLNYFRNNGDEYQKKAAKAFEIRREEGRLPKPRDSKHKVAEFIDHLYTKHRYPL